MSKELVVNANPYGLEIALLQDRKLTEYHQEDINPTFQVGNIYLGKIRKIMPSLNAAFVDMGAEKDGFLTYFDLSPNLNSLKKFTDLAILGNHKKIDLDFFELEPKTEKNGKIKDVLKAGELILIQVIKEPISNKGPKITCDISIADRNFVLVPFSNQISISKKIGSPEERIRLKDAVNALRPKNFGIIVRTAAENIPIEDLNSSVIELKNRWEKVVKNLKNAKSKSLILGEGSKIETLLRDIYDDQFTSIAVNNQDIANQITTYLNTFNTEASKIVKFYNGKGPIFDTYGVTQKIKTSFGRSISFSAGAYLVIEHTEALHVIDVNSGNTSFDPQNREENVYQVNIQAITEIARQIRLRDLGGIIVVDFIDMRDPKKKMDIFNAMKTAMEDDKATHTLLPITKFGLMQITRERVRPEVQIATNENCITCAGTGKMDNPTYFISKLHNQVEYFYENLKIKKLTIKANPLIVSYLTAGMPSIRIKWFLKYKTWLKIESETTQSISDIKYFNEIGTEIIGE